MEGKTNQLREYKGMLELAAVPLAERPDVMSGAAVFFDRGWPSNHFTVGMAVEAGMGMVPPVYQGLGSEGHYFELLKTTSGG